MSSTIKMIVVDLLSQTNTIIEDPKATTVVKMSIIIVIRMATKMEGINMTDKEAMVIIDNTMIIGVKGEEGNNKTIATDKIIGITRGTKKAVTINETGRITIITRVETDRLAKMKGSESLSKRSLTKNR